MTDKKGQSALEFIMTYGWAIMAFLVSIAALFYFGVIPGDITGASVCALSPGINCLEYKVSPLGVTLVLQNSFPYTLTNVAANITNTDQGPCFESAEKTLPEGRSDSFFVRCDNIKKNKFKGDIVVRYRKEGGIQRSFSGTLSTSTLLNKNTSDITPPVVVLTRPDNGFNYTSLTFNLVYNVSDASPVICWYNLDGGSDVNLPDCEDTLISSGLAGTHTVKVFARDENGNSAFDQATFYTNDFSEGDDQLVGAPGCLDNDLDLYFDINSSCQVGTDCNDNNANINPGFAENTALLCSDGLDNNCNGKVDANDISGVPPGEPACFYDFGSSQSSGCDYDADSYGTNDTTISCYGAGTGDDCNDFNASVNPGAAEVCNSIDDNCNGQVDEGGVCPTGPVLLGNYLFGTRPDGLYYDSNYVYVTTVGPLYKILVLDPANPSLSSTLGLAQSIGRFKVDSGYIYGAASPGSLLIIDTSNLNLLYSEGSNLYPWMDAVGVYAYPKRTSFPSGDVVIKNVTIKTAPTNLGSYKRVLTGYTSHDRKLNGDILYISGIDLIGGNNNLVTLDVVDVSNKLSPATLGFIVSVFGTSINNKQPTLYVLGNYAYIANRADALHIFDVSNPASIQEISRYTNQGSYEDVFVTSDNLVYLASGSTRGLLILDVTDKVNPRPVGQYCAPNAGNLTRVFVNGRTAYTTVESSSDYSLKIIDLSYLNIQPLSTINITTCT